MFLKLGFYREFRFLRRRFRSSVALLTVVTSFFVFVLLIAQTLTNEDIFTFKTELVPVLPPGGRFEKHWTKLLASASNNGTRLASAEKHVSRAGVNTLLTLFTTFKISEKRRKINENTLRYWSALRPAIQPALYYTERDDVTFLKEARDLGWLTYKAPAVREGIPVLKDMFAFARDKFATKSLFLGYANSDILFTSQLVELLNFVAQVKWPGRPDNRVILFGKRSDIYVKDLGILGTNLTEENIRKSHVSLNEDMSFALDYFIMSPNTFPFENLPPFIVGKPGWDNYLVAMGLKLKIKTMDCSQAMTVLHQVTSGDEYDVSWFSDNVCYNRLLVEPFYFGNGRSECADYFLTSATTASHLRRNKIAASRDAKFDLFRRLSKPENCEEKSIEHQDVKWNTCEKVVAKKLKRAASWVYQIKRYMFGPKLFPL